MTVYETTHFLAAVIAAAIALIYAGPTLLQPAKVQDKMAGGNFLCLKFRHPLRSLPRGPITC